MIQNNNQSFSSIQQTPKNMSSNLVSQIFKSRTFLLDLLRSNQQFDISEYSDFTMNEVSCMDTNHQLDMLMTNSKEHKVYVKYLMAEPLKDELLRQIIDDLFVMEEALKITDTLVIVTKTKTNQKMDELLKHIWETEGVFVVLFPLQRLQFNICNHELVPRHQVLSEEAKEAVKVKYNIMDDSKFPELSRFDPVAKAILIRPGQLCKITRPSKTTVVTEFYRLCV